MGPMLPEQQEQQTTKKTNKQPTQQLQSTWNIDNHQAEHQDVDLEQTSSENHENSSKNDGNSDEMQQQEQVCRVTSEKTETSNDLVEFSMRHNTLKMLLQPVVDSTIVLRSSDEQQQQQKQNEQQQDVMYEESSVDFTLESPIDVKNNYTRRRRRGRLRSISNHQTETDIKENVKKKHADTRITTKTINNKQKKKRNETNYDEIVDGKATIQHKELKINKNNNNNTALTINLDNNTRKLTLRNKTPQPQHDTEQLQQEDETEREDENQVEKEVKQQEMNKLILEKFTTLPLLLLLLVITSLSKFYRYVHMNINKNIINRKPRRRLAANTKQATTSTTTNNYNKLKFKFKLNNIHKNKIVKNYIFLIGLCVATTILPLNLVNAASPFQNTQKHSNHNNNNNNNNNNNHGGGASSSSAVLTPSPSFPVSSAASSSETEFLYPLSQSEETFDDDDNSLQYSIPPNETDHDNFTVAKTPLFPEDLFTKEQLENGAVICHIIGVIYMFVALAIVCDEFFVPSLDVIIEKLGITDDVAGATFMAAGGSAPELFTSVIGVFVSFDDVGIGTIVGSAVFNILFVIGMCALFSKTVLSLTWWPLFRDCSFYSVSLLILIYFFRDNLIYWWEALILFTVYLAYVGFMKWNQQVERCVKKVITKNKGNAANSSETSMATQPGGSVTSRAASETRSGPAGSSSGATGNSSGGTAGSTQTGAKFRHGLLQLMIHTIDPLHDGKVDEKATQLHAIASLKVLLDATKPQRGGATTSAANHVKINLKETTLADRPNGNIDTTLDSGNEVEDPPEALSMAWPSTARKRLTYVLVAPLLFPMWLTLPDTRTPRGKRFFPVTFIGSIMWIAAYSYLMVWWANVAGDTARIPPEVMGLTFLAAGTSIPDLITSVIVARKGFGDMAVSSSVGSNIFDVTVGLPIPWLLYGIIYDQPVEVNSVGMVCSITILFMMLLFVVLSIACFRWKMNKGLGFTMFLLYFVFVAVSLMFEYNIITCPV